VIKTKMFVLLAAAAAIAAAAPIAAAEVKIGVFDFQRVSEETSRGQELRGALEKFGEGKKSAIAAKEAELKTLDDQYKAQAFSLAPEKRAQMEKDLQKKQLDLQSMRDSAQKEMQLEVNEAQSKFNDELIKVIQSLGKERGYTLVFAKEQVAFAADAVDMTSEVIERFNKDSAKAAAPAPAGGGAEATPPSPGAEPKKP
jgi:Skp family chaperone for outer membrane proteins